MFSRTEQFTRDSGKVIKNMVTEYKNGQMEPVTKECGKTARLVEKENSGMWMVIFLKETGWKIRRMVMGFINILMERAIQVIGKMICNMAKGRSTGSMVANTSVIIVWGGNMDRVNTGGQTVVTMMEFG